MLKCLIAFSISAVLLVVVAQGTVNAEKPTFRILAPEFICGRSRGASNEGGNKTDAVVAAPQQITIGLQTKGGQRLRYKVTILFSLLDQFISQRHTLQLWRSVNELEKQLEKQRDVISTTNQILVPNDKLVPGVIYTFNIVGIDEDGVESNDQNFTVTYRGRNAGTSVDHDGSSARADVSLLLLGAEVTYGDVPYLVTARLIFCEPRNDYKLKWTISEQDRDFWNTSTSSNLLEIPAGVLQPGATYNIALMVFNSTNAEEITKAKMKINVLSRTLKAHIYPTEAVVGFAQNIVIKAQFNNLIKNDVDWSCEDSTADKSCSKDLLFDTNSVSVSFIKEGKHKVMASSKGVVLSSSLDVSTKSTISVVLQKLPPMYLYPGQQYKIAADVRGLVPKCSCMWTVVEEQGYAYFDSKIVGGLGELSINDIEENFLSELVDYGNDTIEREIILTIPGNKEFPNWNGLEPDALYKFRLVIKCPEPIDDSVEGGEKRKIATTFWDMVLETNGPPQGLPLTVTPLENGTALGTFFTFSTGVAKDVESDFPLKYSFWYSVEGNSINFANYYEVMSAEIQLPYSEQKILPYYTVCDSRLACTRVDGQPFAVQTNPSLGDTNVQFQIDSVRKSFDRENYLEATKTAFNLLLTLKNQASTQYDDVYSTLMSILENEIPKVQSLYERSTDSATYNFVIFAQQAKILIEFKHDSNDRLLTQLLELIDAVEKKPSRQKRAADAVPSTKNAHTIQMKISLLEKLIASTNGTVESKERAKSELLSYIHEAAEPFCKNYLEGGPTNYADEWFTLDTSKIKANKNPLRGSARIPRNNSTLKWAVLNVTASFAPSTSLDTVDYFCIGRVQFNRDLLSSERDVNFTVGLYEMFVVTVDKTGFGKREELKNGTYSWKVYIGPIEATMKYQCELLGDQLMWDANLCKSGYSANYVICNCTQMNYLRVVAINQTNFEEHDITTIGPSNMTTTNSDITVPAQPTIPSTTETVYINNTESTISVTSLNTFPSIYPTASNETSTTTKPMSDPIPSDTTSLGTSSTTIAIQPTTKAATTPTTILAPITNEPPATSSQFAMNTTIEHRTASSGAGTLEYSIIAALVFCVALTVVALLLYRRRRNTSSLVEDLQFIAGRVRIQSPQLRYARFQDEHTMNGDDVSTISDKVTV